MGNIRTTLTEEQRTDAYPMATIEAANATASTRAGGDIYKSNTISDSEITKNSYLHIYVSNETPNISVYFDQLQVTHIRGPLLQEKVYYPYGLEMKGISAAAMDVNEGNTANQLKKKGLIDRHEVPYDQPQKED